MKNFGGVVRTAHESSLQQELESKGLIQSDNNVHADLWQGNEVMRQRAIDAAITAYGDALRFGDPKGLACRAALRAYLKYDPDDTSASDEVVKAIASTTFGYSSER